MTPYIPADSSYEVVMADALAARRRAFIKPLRYDTADAVLPDFVLTDVTPAAYVEVYGIGGQEAYERRKAEKQAFYRRQAGQLIEWDVAQPLPALARSGQRPADRAPDGDHSIRGAVGPFKAPA